MNKNEFKLRLGEILKNTAEQVQAQKIQLESCRDWFGHTCNVFQYAATSEHNMERLLDVFGKGKRKTTFMSDLSIGDWYGLKGLLDTVKNAVPSWCSNHEYMAEFTLCLAWKAEEMYARKKNGWGLLYASLFEEIRDLMYDYYAGDDEKLHYYWQYLD